MPKTKLAFVRYLAIDQCLRNKLKKYPSPQELLEVCREKFGVTSISTLEKDLAAMRLEFDAPIVFDKKQKGYYYADPQYKFLNVNLSEEQLTALRFVETFLEEFKYVPIFNEFSDAVDKVLDGLEITRNFSHETKNIQQFIQIDKSPYFKGSDMLSQLVREISRQKVLEITYQKFTSEQEKHYTIHPYLLKEFKNFWYLTGYVEEYRQFRTFGIDRIIRYQTVENRFMPPAETGFQADRFFKHCYGITALDEEPQKIILSFTPFLGNYIRNQPLHSSQVILADNETEFRIGLELVINHELQNLVLSYGADLTVVSPVHFRNAIRQELQKAIGYYLDQPPRQL